MERKVLGVSLRFHIVCSFVTLFFAIAMCITADKEGVSLGGWCSDHYSHTGSSIMFLLKKDAIYRVPASSLCDHNGQRHEDRQEAADSLDQKSKDICFASFTDFKRPLVINWQNYPRPYPPGHLLYFLPEALLYKYSGASFKTVNCVSIVKFVLIAHLAWVFLAALLIEIKSRPLSFFLLAFSYSQLMSIALSGIYDGVVVLAACAGMWAYKKDRLMLSLFLLCTGVFLHFRMLWFAPFLALVCYKSFGLFKSGALKKEGLLNRGFSYAACALSLIMLALTAWTFFTLWPYLTKYPQNSPLYYESIGLESKGAIAHFVVTIGVLAFFLYTRATLIFSVICCSTLFFLRAPQAWFWHHHILLACLALPLIGDKKNNLLEELFFLFVWYLAVCLLVFKASIWPTWISDFLLRLSG